MKSTKQLTNEPTIEKGEQAPIESVELTEDTKKQSEDTQEEQEDQQANVTPVEETSDDSPNEEVTHPGDMVVIRYKGNGIWKDSNGELWSREDKSDSIKSERQYTMEEIYERKDLEYMVETYGTMEATVVKMQ